MTHADRTADNGLHGRLEVGTPVPVASIPGLAALLPKAQVTLSHDGTLVDTCLGANVLDSPLNAPAFLVQVLAAQPDTPPLAAGEISSTDTLTDAHPVKSRETWRTAFSGLPLHGLTVTFS